MNNNLYMGKLQPQHIPTVENEEAINKLRIGIDIGLDSDVVFLDEHQDIAYICKTDSLGKIFYESYDLIKRKTKQESRDEQFTNALLLINQRLENLEAKLNESDIIEIERDVTESSDESITDSATSRKDNENFRSNGKPKGNGRTGTR